MNLLDHLPLETPRLRLPLCNAESADEVFGAIEEDRGHLSGWMRWDPHESTRESTWHFLDNARLESQKGKQLVLEIRENKSGRFLGTVGAIALDEVQGRAELGYWLRASATGKGYAAEAVGALTDILIENGFREITARVLIDNVRSTSLLKKLGFEEKGRGNALDVSGPCGTKEHFYFVRRSA